MMEVVILKFHFTPPGDLLERFRENNLAKVNLLKLLIKENLLGCSH